MRGARRALFSLLAICTSVHAADVQRAPETFALSIDRQPLDGALQQLARQCDVQVILFSRVTEGLIAPAMRGDYTLAAAIEQLLAGSGLTFRVINPQTVEVRPSQAKSTDRSRSPAEPVGRQPDLAPQGSLEEVVVVGLAEQLVATRIATPLHLIPQTISIVTGEQMRQRNEFTLADVLEHAPGITMDRNSSLDQNFYARGYQITSFHIDGGAAIIPKLDPSQQAGGLYLGTPDLIEFDHVEILRGSDALFSGNGNPGGTISLVRKRPQRNFALELNAAAGSWDDQRVALDITGPLALDGALRGRGAAVYSHDGYFYDIDAHERTKIFAAFEYDLTDEATITAGGSYQWDKAAGVGAGVPLYADGRDSQLPREATLDFDWTRYRSELGGVYVQYRQQLAQDWALKLNAARSRTAGEFAFGIVSGPIDPVTNEVNQRPFGTFSASPNIHRQYTADATLSGTLNWFGWREEVALGADFTRVEIDSDNEGDFGFGAPVGDPRTFDVHDYPDPRLAGPPIFRIVSTTDAEQYGMFASARIYFADAWSIVGGARISGDSTDLQLTLRNNLLGGDLIIPLDFGTDHVVTPYAGVMYAFDPQYSLYASYADIYLSQIGVVEQTPGNLLGPRRGVNIEAGIKGEWRNGALNGSLAVYRTEQSNEPRSTTTQAPPGFPDCCFRGVTSKSRGVDAEINGELAPGWHLGAGYTYNENESPEGDALSAITPKHLLKAWTNVRLRGALDRWEIGGSVHAQSQTVSRNYDFCPAGSECTSVHGVQPEYAIFDLHAGFAIDRNWHVSLAVNNLLDETYYESIDMPQLHAWYGEPRSWMLRIDGNY
jgi:outer-membrane receptor for ferric coprogen and ferric-rhodotorulic acid